MRPIKITIVITGEFERRPLYPPIEGSDEELKNAVMAVLPAIGRWDDPVITIEELP